MPIDVKATALLKLVYLEMVGYDMSWASFHVLEVMSSPKYHQKRVGYLGAVQSFRPDTEVLMLATNLLKKVRPCLQHLVKLQMFPLCPSCRRCTNIYVTFIGPWIIYTNSYFSPHCYTTACHHAVFGALDSGRPAPSTRTQPLQY